MRSRDETTLAVPAGPLWFKVTGMLQQNWCTVVNQHDGKAEAVFFDDLSSVFDRLLFESRDDCERALRFNGFTPLDEDPGFCEIAGEPSFPLRESARSHRPVYSSGEYWHVPPEEFVHRPARRRVREGLERFLKAQEQVFDVALSELRSGQKSTHWMWFIFPQIRGLGTSGMSRKFGIDSLDEARDYLDHALLGTRLMDCMSVLWALEGSSARDIFGSVDALKLRSCLTLFAKASASQLRRTTDDKPAFQSPQVDSGAQGSSSDQQAKAMFDHELARNPRFIFEQLLSKYFSGRTDEKTLRILEEQDF